MRLVLIVNSVSKALNRVEKIPICVAMNSVNQQFASEGSPIFYQISVVSFREQKGFVLKTRYFSRIRLRHM